MAAPAAPIKCRAMVAWGANQALEMEEIEVDAPQAGEVRIRMVAASVCHTDLTFLGIEQVQFPRIFGHEGAGIVESLGEGVEDLKIGDHVLPVYMGECGQCTSCSETTNNFCEKYWLLLKTNLMLDSFDQKPRFSVSKEGRNLPVFPFLTSTFSEYTVVNADCCAKISQDIPLDKACLFSCGLSTGLGAVWKVAKVHKGSTVAVFGLGTIGLATVVGAKIAGASRIIGVDVNPSKFELANKFGVTDCVNPDGHTLPIQQVLQDLTNGGVDYSFECVGNVNVMAAAIESTREGAGKTVILGADTLGRQLAINPMSLFGRSVTSCSFGGWKGKTDVPSLVNKITTKEIPVDDFITHVLPFENTNQAMDLLRNGKSLRCILTFA